MKHGLSKKEELLLRNDIIMETVELLNKFGEFLQCPSNSPQEDQLEAELDEKVAHLMERGVTGLGGHIILALLAMVHNCADPDTVQQWLDDAGEVLLQEAGELDDE